MKNLFGLRPFYKRLKDSWWFPGVCVCKGPRDINFIIHKGPRATQNLRLCGLSAEQVHASNKNIGHVQYMYVIMYVVYFTCLVPFLLGFTHTVFFLIFPFSCYSAKQNKQRSSSSVKRSPSCFLVHMCGTCPRTHTAERSVYRSVGTSTVCVQVHSCLGRHPSWIMIRAYVYLWPLVTGQDLWMWVLSSSTKEWFFFFPFQIVLLKDFKSWRDRGVPCNTRKKSNH